MKTRKQIAFFGIAAVFAVMGAVALAGCGEGEEDKGMPINLPYDGKAAVKGYSAEEAKVIETAIATGFQNFTPEEQDILGPAVFARKDIVITPNKNIEPSITTAGDGKTIYTNSNIPDLLYRARFPEMIASAFGGLYWESLTQAKALNKSKVKIAGGGMGSAAGAMRVNLNADYTDKEGFTRIKT